MKSHPGFIEQSIKYKNIVIIFELKLAPVCTQYTSFSMFLFMGVHT